LNNFFDGLIVELVGFALTSIAVFLIFQWRDTKNLKTLKKTVYSRLKNKIINPFIANTIENLRLDIMRPSIFTSLLIKAPVASEVMNMEQLQKKLLESFKNKELKELLSVRNEQWKIIISEGFLVIMKMIVGHWSSKQWKKYSEYLEESLKQLRDLLDLYQSRLPPEIVCKLIEYENKVDGFTRTMKIFPEFFSRIDELEIPITSKFLANRRSFQRIVCENLYSIFKDIDELKEEL